jgi:hypothetical protein
MCDCSPLYEWWHKEKSSPDFKIKVILFIVFGGTLCYYSYTEINKCIDSYTNLSTKLGKISFTQLSMPGVIICTNFNITETNCTFTDDGFFENPTSNCLMNTNNNIRSFFNLTSCIDANFEINAFFATSIESEISISFTVVPNLSLSQLLLILLVYNQTEWKNQDPRQIAPSSVIRYSKISFVEGEDLTLQSNIQLGFSKYPNGTIRQNWIFEVIPQIMNGGPKTQVQAIVKFRSLEADFIDYYVEYDAYNLLGSIGGFVAGIAKTSFAYALIGINFLYPKIREWNCWNNCKRKHQRTTNDRLNQPLIEITVN